jgi:Domain of unknown function (DUF5615)
MKVSFYFDEMMPHIPAESIQAQGYEVVVAAEVDMLKKDDLSEHLPYATERGLVIVTMDHPFAGKVSARTDHAGLICWTGDQNDVGGIIRKLIEFAETYEAEDVVGQVFWLKD